MKQSELEGQYYYPGTDQDIPVSTIPYVAIVLGLITGIVLNNWFIAFIMFLSVLGLGCTILVIVMIRHMINEFYYYFKKLN